MKIRKWHLYVIIISVFCMVFVYINQKYDRFYRVNGINNDNRALIEQYLDSEEQKYLVDNAISVDEFISFIEEPDFNLFYYPYYNELKESKKYSSNKDIVTTGNSIANRLDFLYGEEGINYCRILIRNDLIDAYVTQEDFDFDNIPFYQAIRTIYNNTDYIVDVNDYIRIFESENITDSEDILFILENLTGYYTADTLSEFMRAELPNGVSRNYDVSSLDIVIDKNTYIGSYEPKDLTMVQGIPRTTYMMYLTKEAYEALGQMYHDMQEVTGSGCILLRSYRSYDVLNLDATDPLELAGFSEFQLGTTIRLYNQDAPFVSTPYYEWLLQNSYKYGYILRYPQDKANITGVDNRLDVYRYVGIELATYLHDHNLTLEEYHLQENN